MWECCLFCSGHQKKWCPQFPIDSWNLSSKFPLGMCSHKSHSDLQWTKVWAGVMPLLAANWVYKPLGLVSDKSSCRKLTDNLPIFNICQHARPQISCTNSRGSANDNNCCFSRRISRFLFGWDINNPPTHVSKTWYEAMLMYYHILTGNLGDFFRNLFIEFVKPLVDMPSSHLFLLLTKQGLFRLVC